MKSSSDGGGSDRSSGWRKWLVRAGIALLVLEVVYVVAANVFLRTGLLLDLINKKPEKMNISWDSVTTYFPGIASVSNFELRSQTRKDQIYLRVAEADARISLVKLAIKTIHIRGVDAKDVDFRYRERLDRPPKAGADAQAPKEPVDPRFWPEIPGYSNPPDPKPEDLYPLKKKKHPWTIKITGADVEGPVKVALGDARIEGEGSVGGGVTVKPRETITIHRGRLHLKPATIEIGPDVITRDLAIDADLRFRPFPAKGAKIEDVLGGISGDLAVAGELGERAAVRYEITPGISAFGAGTIDARFEIDEGVLRAGTEYSLKSDSFHVIVMGLDASGSAAVSGGTQNESGEYITTAHISLGDFRFVDPEDGSVDISGTGLEVQAEWTGLSIGAAKPASHVDFVLPPARIHDVSTFNSQFPEATGLKFESGSGTVQSRLEIEDRVAKGTLDLVAEKMVLSSLDTPLVGDLEVHANLAEGDLPAKTFDLSGTTIRLDKIVSMRLPDKKQEKLDPWFLSVALGKGDITFGKPMAVDGSAKIEMYDTRPVIALLKRLGIGPSWLSKAPNIKDVDGALDVSVGNGSLAFSDLNMTGEGFEALGWVDIRDKKADGRIFVRFKSVMAGVGLDQGKTKIHLSKPRKWFDEQPKGPQSSPAREATAED